MGIDVNAVAVGFWKSPRIYITPELGVVFIVYVWFIWHGLSGAPFLVL
jgi:hypothetical protein